MSMNIYIKPELEKKLRDEESMSGLINKLLADYYLLETVHGRFVRLNDLEQAANNVIQSKHLTDMPEYDDPTYTDPEEAA